MRIFYRSLCVSIQTFTGAFSRKRTKPADLPVPGWNQPHSMAWKHHRGNRSR